MLYKKRILVAAVNRGLGHATRCIPVIEALENHGFEPVLASDGAALDLLTKEFPHLTNITLPPCPVTALQKKPSVEMQLLLTLPGMVKAVANEGKTVRELVSQYSIDGIISDNRPGMYSKTIPSVFLTHRLNMLTGPTSWLSTKIHRAFIKKFTECWVPDMAAGPNLTGKVGHTEDVLPNLKYIGPLSRMHKITADKKYDLMVLLSGPEPHRAQLREKLEQQLKDFGGKVLFITGTNEAAGSRIEGNITYHTCMDAVTLEQAFNESAIVLCRPGYTTIMDLARLGKKALFIPVPGFYEQEYFAKKLKKAGLVPYVSQDDFNLDDLEKVHLYQGLKHINSEVKWKDLFGLFEGE